LASSAKQHRTIWKVKALMPISITCHGCGKRLKAKDSLAGRTVPCPSCGTKLVIDSADDIAAALLRDDAEPQAGEPEAAAPSEDAAPEREAAPPRRPTAPSIRRKPPRAADVTTLQALTTNDPPLWLRHLHWLLALSLIPLAASLLQKSEEPDIFPRLIETIQQAPEDSRPRIVQALEDVKDDQGSLETLFAALPNHKLVGAWLPRDSHIHWLLTAGAVLLFFLFLLALTLEGSAKAQHLLLLGVFTATIGLLFLFCVQALAEWSQRFIIIPTNIVSLVFYIFWLIGFSYRAANDPNSNFFLSLMGFTFGVGLCEEICKALPVIFIYHRPNGQSWRGAYLWGLASGAGFGLAEAVLYAGGFYNGIQGAGIYFVRNISCVALHALWTGSAAITIHQRQRWFQEEMRWYDWIVRAIAVVAVPMVLHGLYDTLLKKDCNAWALAVAVGSFVWLAFQISRLRGADDETAQADMLREYQRRRKAMPGR
jgi:RsiW-degrading membrane proteinase PrsW (M82 family)